MALVYFFCVQDFIYKIFIMYYLLRFWPFLVTIFFAFVLFLKILKLN